LLLPEKLVRQAFVRASRADTTVARAPASGIPELQAWFAAELARLTPASVSAPTAHDVIVLPGSQNGLSAAFRALVGPGQPIVMESPTYWGAIMAAEHAGVPVVPVATGPDGPDLDALDRALTLSNARAFYAQPNFSNPTGGQWGPERASEVLALVQKHGAFLIEDDWAHDFGIDGDSTPLAAHDEDGHVVYLRSLTKSVSPAVRVAGVVARGPARDRLLAATQAEFMYVSSALQSIAHDVVTQPAWRTHGRAVRQQLTARRDTLVAALATHIPGAQVDRPRGGLNTWVRLPDGTDLPRLVRDCELLGVMVAPGDEWFPAEPTGPFLRLNYSGPRPEDFDAGAERIGQALADQNL
jgi:DNA-binding transcriptional MocR family regulator